MTPKQDENVRLLRDSAAAIAPPGPSLGGSQGGSPGASQGASLSRVRALRFGLPGFDREVWRQMASMGWIGLRVPEALGGAGLGLVEACALMAELGAGLVPEPLAPAMAVAPLLPPDVLARALDGSAIVLPAAAERPDSIAPGTDTQASGGRVSGLKQFIPMGAGADLFLVSVWGGAVLVEAGAPGVELDTALTQDGGHVATLRLHNAPCRPLAAAMGDALDDVALLTAASLLGAMERSFALTLDYMRTRKQFGRAIGSFQALQHRAADLQVQVALTRASIESAAAALDAGAVGAPRQAAVSRAKARAAEGAMRVTRECIQLHGGIGYTDEYDVGLFLRRAMVLSNQYGSAARHRARFAALSPEPADA